MNKKEEKVGTINKGEERKEGEERSVNMSRGRKDG